MLLQNEEVLEFRGAAAAKKSVVGRKLPWAMVHLDNQGVLWGLKAGKVGIGMQEQRRCVRQVMNALAKGGTSVHLSYVPGAIMPADYPSRVRRNFFGDKSMALGSAFDQMADLLPGCFLGGGGDGGCRWHSSKMVTRHYVLWVQQCP